MTRRFVIAVLAAGMCFAAATSVGAQVKPKAKRGPGAAGVVNKLDTSAKTFTLATKKRGDLVIAYTDKTTFRKAPAAKGEKPAAGSLTDLKNGETVAVRGKEEGGKLLADVVLIGKRGKK